MFQIYKGNSCKFLSQVIKLTGHDSIITNRQPALLAACSTIGQISLKLFMIFNVATKNRLPEHLQLKLAKDSDSSVRQRIVYNKKATFQVLSILINDEDEDIRTLAKNRIDEGRYK